MSDDQDNQEPSKLARILPVTVVMLAVVGFFSLAWYAYHAGNQPVKEEELTLIEADKSPMKEIPQDAGGMKFPHQDKSIYDTLSDGQKKPQVERVLPAPEAPAKPVAEAKKLVEKPVEKPAEQVITEIKEKPPVEKPREKLEEKPVVDAKKAAPVKGVEVSEKPEKAAEPVQQETKEAAEEKPEAAVEPAKEESQEKPVSEEKPKPEKPIAAPKTSGSGKVQLAALQSEEEAEEVWTGILKKHGDVLGSKKPTIVRADLGEKGVFYRLQVHGVDAKSMCEALSARKQSCMVVK